MTQSNNCRDFFGTFLRFGFKAMFTWLAKVMFMPDLNRLLPRLTCRDHEPDPGVLYLVI